MPPDRLYDVPEAASRLHVGRTKAWELVYAGKLRTVRIGRRRLVPESALADFIDDLAGLPPDALQRPDRSRTVVLTRPAATTRRSSDGTLQSA